LAIDISKALEIKGWCTPTELAWLAHKASQHERIVEVGSWMGRSTRALSDNTPGQVWAVDTWQGSEELKHFLADKPPDWLYESFIKNMGERNNVVPVRMPSLEASKALGDILFDMIFIDASHDYENVKQDIEIWRPHLKSGGLLCGHDFAPGWPGVIKAVSEYFPDVARSKALAQRFGPPDWSNNSIWHVVVPS
jgi:predicted O-methyltransferase YrrM